MTLHPTTIKAIGEYHEKRRRLEAIRNDQLAWIARQWAFDGYGVDDIVAHTPVPREIARAAVFGAKR